MPWAASGYNHRVAQKVQQTFIHIFAKYLLIIKMFSPAHSVMENLPQSGY